MSWRPSLRQLLLGVNVVILAAPLLAVSFLPVVDAYLTRQTERSLIAQSVLIGEAWRDRWLQAKGIEATPGLPSPSWSFRPPGHSKDRFVPIEPTLDLTYRVLPPAEASRARVSPPVDEAAVAAGLAVTPTMHRAKVFLLTGARVLDRAGCVVATSRGEIGRCLRHLEEVGAALRGSYRSVVRQRLSDEPLPPLRSIRSRGDLRVFVAIPVFHDGEVIGAVWSSRTSRSPLETMWAHRGKLALLLVVYLVAVPASTYFLSHQISKPVRTLTRLAEQIARGEPGTDDEPGALAPREVVRLREALDKMTARLTDRANTTEEFARTLSHELKTPITAISGAVELLVEEADSMSPEQRSRFLANIASDADRMDRLVTRLLHLARVRSQPDDVEPVDAASVLQDILAGTPQKIDLQVEDDLPLLMMNREHLEVAIRNLVDNAIRHGQGKAVSIRARRRGPKLEISVRDRGPGISPANRERIFERFFTTARDAGGTGLGLSIVQAVAVSRGGSIEVDSDDDGTEFRLVL